MGQCSPVGSYREGGREGAALLSSGILKAVALLSGSPNLRTRPPPRRESSLVCGLSLHSSSGVTLIHLIPLKQSLWPRSLGSPGGFPLPGWRQGQKPADPRPPWSIARQFIIGNALHSKAK